MNEFERAILTRRRDHPVLDPRNFEVVVKRALDAIRSYVSRLEASHPDVFGADRDDDSVRDRWDALLEDRIGPPLQPDKTWYQEAESRYEAGTPPGYADRKKETQARTYGDLILWFELLGRVAELREQSTQNVPVIFVTDDAKEDWWRDFDGENLGPRLELVKEIAAVGGVPFWIYSLARFMEIGAERLKWEPVDVIATLPPVDEVELDPTRDEGASSTETPKDTKV